MFIIKWTNKFSNETGFVESIDTKEKHFNNTFDQASAKQYNKKNTAYKNISKLRSFGEGDNNTFEILSI